MNNRENQQLTKRERRELRRQEKERQQNRINRPRFYKKWAKRIIIALIVILGIGGLVWYGATRPKTSTGDILTIAADDWMKGDKNAKVTLIEYLDFECEACGAYHPAIKQLENDFGSDFNLVVRYFPLPGHKNGLTAALAAEAAGQQGKFWEMHNKLFENQKDWGERQAADSKIFERYAQDIGLDIEKFKTDVNSQSVKERVERDRQAARKLNLSGTPSFFLNGEKIQNPRNYEEFKSVIEKAITSSNSK